MEDRIKCFFCFRFNSSLKGGGRVTISLAVKLTKRSAGVGKKDCRVTFTSNIIARNNSKNMVPTHHPFPLSPQEQSFFSKFPSKQEIRDYPAKVRGFDKSIFAARCNPLSLPLSPSLSLSLPLSPSLSLSLLSFITLVFLLPHVPTKTTEKKKLSRG